MARLRTRSRYQTAIEGSTNRGVAHSSAGFTELDPLPLVYVKMSESIKDRVTPRGVFPLLWHPCSHAKVRNFPGTPGPFVNEGIPPFVVSFTGAWIPAPFESPAFASTSLIDVDIEHAENLLPSSEEASTFTLRAFLSITDQFPNTVSFANFLWELRDLKGMVNNIKNWITAPGAFLSWNFGWLPMIQDLKKLLTVCADVNKRLAHLKRVNKRVVTITHQEQFLEGSLEEPGVSPGGGSMDPSYPNPPPMLTTTQYAEYDVRMNTGVYYDLTIPPDWEAFLSGMCAALGLLNPVKIIWNAIPWSFVVDWIINLSQFLDTATELQPFQGTIAIQWCTCSVKTHVRFVHWTKSNRGLLGNDTYAPFASSLYTVYHRRVGSPNSSIELSGLTPFQQALAGALLAARVDNRLPRRFQYWTTLAKYLRDLPYTQ
jgi:hypothetical protein